MREILFLAHRIPFPPDRGDKIRSFHELKHLAGLGRVHLACFADDEADAAHLAALREALGGGLGGLLGGLRDQGLGQKVESWVGHGENHPVAPHEVERTFDPADLDEAARRAGTDRGTLLDELSRMLPGMVDGMTPQGRLPQRGEEIGGGGGIGGLLGRLLGGGGR